MSIQIVVTVSDHVVHPDDTFDVNIEVMPDTDIAGAQASISFDPESLEVNSVSEGDLFSQTGQSTFFIPGTINADSVTGIAGIIIGQGQSVNGAGTLVTLHCTAKTVGKVSNFVLSDIIVADVGAQPLPFELGVIDQVSVVSFTDINLDGFVDLSDLQLVASAFLTVSEPEDINVDGIVDVLDLVLVGQDFTAG